MKVVRVSKPEPFDVVVYCGLCGLEIDVKRGELRFPSAMQVGIAEASRLTHEILRGRAEKTERLASSHLSGRHPVRYWLWRRLGWRWLLTRPIPLVRYRPPSVPAPPAS